MMSDILHWAVVGLGLILFVLVLMTPFIAYLYWLNSKQSRYFQKLGKELGLTYTSMGNKFKRDFPELNGSMNGVQCFIGARRSKGRSGSSAQTRNHYPIIMIQAAINLQLEELAIDVTGKEIKHQCKPTLRLKADTFTKLQHYAAEFKDVRIHLAKPNIIQVLMLDELSNQKQYDRVVNFMPIFIQFALDINSNSKS